MVRRAALLVVLSVAGCHTGDVRGTASNTPEELEGTTWRTECGACVKFSDLASASAECRGDSGICAAWEPVAPGLVLLDNTKTVQTELRGDELHLYWFAADAGVHHVTLKAYNGTCP